MESISEDLKIYFIKLLKTIETQASFTLGNKRIVNKTRIDDILCCIDVNFPEILKKYNKVYGIDKNVKSFDLYKQLIANIKNKPLLFGKDSYAVNYKEVLAILQLLEQSLNADINYVLKTYPELTKENP